MTIPPPFHPLKTSRGHDFHLVSKNIWRETIPAIRVYLRFTNESVRISAIWVLGKCADEESRPVFDEAASSPRPRIQSAGKLALANLNASAGKNND